MYPVFTHMWKLIYIKIMYNYTCIRRDTQRERETSKKKKLLGKSEGIRGGGAEGHEEKMQV